ncbi:hypothetical protein [Caballeronia insecticola]|nr:hypothetical protein [Caballeronia insecticola]
MPDDPCSQRDRAGHARDRPGQCPSEPVADTTARRLRDERRRIGSAKAFEPRTEFAIKRYASVSVLDRISADESEAEDGRIAFEQIDLGRAFTHAHVEAVERPVAAIVLIELFQLQRLCGPARIAPLARLRARRPAATFERRAELVDHVRAALAQRIEAAEVPLADRCATRSAVSRSKSRMPPGRDGTMPGF